MSVTAVNCVGSSTPAMTDPVEFGMSTFNLYSLTTFNLVLLFNQLAARYYLAVRMSPLNLILA